VGRIFNERLLSAAALVALLLALVALDDRVRDVFSVSLSGGQVSANFGTAGVVARQVPSAVMVFARDHSLAQAPLLIFALGAGVLVFFMLRT
jgi:hypothetical protein